MGQVLDEGAHIGARVRVRWAEIVVVGIAEGVSRDRSRMEHAEPGVVEANRPAAHFQAARVPPAHKLPKNVSAVLNDPRDLGLDREPLPARGRRVEINCAVLGKVDLSLWASRLKEAAGVIGARETDAVRAGAVTNLSERRIVADVEKVPGVCPDRPVHSSPLQSAFAGASLVLSQSLPPAKLSAPADVKPPRSERVDAINSPRNHLISARGSSARSQAASMCTEATTFWFAPSHR